MIIRVHYFSIVLGAIAGALIAKKYWISEN